MKKEEEDEDVDTKQEEEEDAAMDDAPIVEVTRKLFYHNLIQNHFQLQDEEFFINKIKSSHRMQIRHLLNSPELKALLEVWFFLIFSTFSFFLSFDLIFILISVSNNLTLTKPSKSEPKTLHTRSFSNAMK